MRCRGRRPKCARLAWRDADPVWRNQHANDTLVFTKLLREMRRGRKIAAVIRRLFRSKLWSPRMSGKSAASWRVNFYRWLKG